MITIPPFVETSMLEGLNRWLNFGKLWNEIKKICDTPKCEKFLHGSCVAIPCALGQKFVVADICNYNGVNVYFLEYQNNKAYQLILSEDHILSVDNEDD